MKFSWCESPAQFNSHSEERSITMKQDEKECCQCNFDSMQSQGQNKKVHLK